MVSALVKSKYRVNRSSIESHFLHHQGGDDSNDHEDVSQDGALLCDLGVQTVVGGFQSLRAAIWPLHTQPARQS
jgi:hypothetical protein